MNYYIAVEIPATCAVSELASTLQRAYDDGADGDFEIIHTAGKSFVVIFERSVDNDIEYVSKRIASVSVNVKKAAMEQLADELQEGDSGSLTVQIVEALRNEKATCFDFNIGAFSAMGEFRRVKQRELLAKFGYTIQSNLVGCTGESWWALLPGESHFQDDSGDPHKQNYVGFFSSEDALLDEVSGDLEFKRSEQIKSEYLASGCQSSDLDDAVDKLMNECVSLFENDSSACLFLLGNTQEEMETGVAIET